MMPKEILLNLLEQKREIERDAVRKFQLGIGLPYPKELKEIDEQIKEAEKRAGTFSGLVGNHLIIESEVERNERARKERQEKIDGITKLQNKLNGLSKVNSIKLRILEKLKEEWDIYPNKDKYTISQSKYWGWIRGMSIDDFPQFENFLLAFKKDGLIDRFDFIPDYV